MYLIHFTLQFEDMSDFAVLGPRFAVSEEDIDFSRKTCEKRIMVGNPVDQSYTISIKFKTY